MRLKKVMAIMLAAGLTVGSLALASTADVNGRSVADASATPVPELPENAEPNSPGGIGNVVAPATVAPATDAPATDAPATDAPATDAPATDAPATDAPATDAPATDAPSTPSEETTVKKPAKVAKVAKKNITVAQKKVTVKVAKVKGAKGYQIKVSTKKNFKKNVKTVTAKTAKLTVKGLKKNTKYFFKVRAYKNANGKKVFGKWSAVQTVKTAK